MSTVINQTAQMGCGTAWGGHLPCKQEIQLGSIPGRSIENLIILSGMRCKGLHASPGTMRRSSSLTFPICPISLTVVISGSQPEDAGFNSLIGYCGCGRIGYASDCGSEGCGFKSRRSHHGGYSSGTEAGLSSLSDGVSTHTVDWAVAHH